MKEYFTYDDPPIDSPPQCNSAGEPPQDNHKLLELFRESPDDGQIALVDSMLPNNPQNVKTNHMEDLEELNHLPESTKSLQLNQKEAKIKITISALMLYPVACSTME